MHFRKDTTSLLDRNEDSIEAGIPQFTPIIDEIKVAINSLPNAPSIDDKDRRKTESKRL